MRFSSPPGVNASDVMKSKVAAKSVHLVALCNLCFDDSPGRLLEQKLAKTFPKMRRLFLDWALYFERDLDFDKFAKSQCARLAQIYSKLALDWVAIQCIVPLRAQQDAARKTLEYFRFESLNLAPKFKSYLFHPIDSLLCLLFKS